jgi:hypothetical protein
MNPPTLSDLSEPGFLRSPNRGNVGFFSNIPETPAGLSGKLKDFLNGKCSQTFSLVLFRGPRVSNLQIILVHERKPEISRENTRTMDDCLVVKDEQQAIVSVSQQS